MLGQKRTAYRDLVRKIERKTTRGSGCTWRILLKRIIDKQDRVART
jgi:hypothetical protein